MPKADWIWLRPAVLIAVHDEQIAEHGGRPGLRSSDRLELALARPRDLVTHGEPDVAEVAAAYGLGIARHRPFVDGNDRTAFIALELFLTLNGHAFAATDEKIVGVAADLAISQLSEEEFAAWVRQHVPRARIMASYQASQETFASLYRNLAE